jgi:hypothetical protein
MALTRWSARSPDLSIAISFCGNVLKTEFVPLLPVSVNNLKQGITAAVASVDEDMLRCVWDELDSPIHICRVREGSCIERL